MKKKSTEIKIPEHSKDMKSSYKTKFHDLLDLTRSSFHELSQPVTVLLGYSELMLSNMDINDPLYNKLHEINKQAEKTNEIIRRMRMKIKYISEENTSDSKVIGKI